MKVYLIGAGPGDPELITVKAVRAIGACDTVVYDDLIAEEILLLAKPGAEKLYVGKRAGKDYMRQNEINQLLLDLARQGRTIARIKGGDPCVFGRGGEEALYLKRNGIACEIIPGISSAIAGPISVGIPPTHRGLAASLKIVTAHEDPTKETGFLDWSLLARESGTIVFLMGATRLGAIAERLIAEGMDANTPCAFIQNATLPSRRHVLTTLAQAGEAAASHGIASPCVMVVGKVCDLSAELGQAPDLPLKGQSILITRPSHLAFQTAAFYASQGARTYLYPLIAIQDLPFDLPDIGVYDIIIFTSQNAVPLFMGKLYSAGHDSRALAGKEIYCIGPKTKEALARYGIIPDGMAAEFRAEGIMDMLAGQDLHAKRVCLPRAQGARPYLVQALHEKGAQVDEILVYATVMPAGADKQSFTDVLAKVDTVIFTSPSGAKNAQALLGDDLELLKDKRLVAIGPVTAGAMRKLGMAPDLTAHEYTDQGIMEILQRSTT